MRSLLRLPLLGLLCILSVVTQSAFASVLAIDYGSDWIKASLMKPGVPFDVLLNKDSKRKIQSSVGWKRNDRLFGSDAFNIAGRFPTDSFSSIKYLQGVPYNSETVAFFTSISPATLSPTSRGTVSLTRADPSSTQYTPEELVAMQFAYVKDLAEALAGEKVTDVIVTVPPFYTQFEKDAVVDAIEISGLKTVALINDGTAVAVNYAMTRSFPTPEHHIIYDAGASSVRATVVTFLTVPNDPKVSSMSTSKDSTHITVGGVGFDRKVGGTELDRRLRDILVEDFWRKHRKDIRTDKRGMAKLWKEAGRVKTILSANAEAVATVESVAFDIDFKTKVSRADFEDACVDLKGKWVQPIFDALQNAGMTMGNITSVIMAGGSSRTPMVQAAIKAAIGEEKLAWNVNADEAAVLGAALHGASLSRQFKTKEMKVTDISPYDIQVSYAAESTTSKSPRTIHTVVFPAGSKVGSKKTLTFKRKEDFGVRLGYKGVPVAGFPTDLLEVEITGITEAIGNLTEWGAVDPVVKATVMLSESGFVSVQSAVAFGEIKDDTITGKLKGLFGAGSATSEGGEETESVGGQTESSSATSSSGAASPTQTPVKGPNSIELKLNVKFPSIPPMTVSEKRKSRDKLLAVDNEEKAKQRKEEARNLLESYLYRVRDLLEEGGEQTPFMKCSKEEERRRIRQKLEETFGWLHDKADEAETWQLVEKRSTLESLERPIVHRYKEIEEFPRALNNSQMWNWSTRLFLTEAKTNLEAEEASGAPSKYTHEDLAALEKTLVEHEIWLNENVEKQKGVKMNEDPVVESEEMRRRAKKLEEHLQRLVKRKVPLRRKTTTTTTTSTGTSGSPKESASGHDEL
ncbi:hypothetical protein JAAARDRAFT_36678 [Jaapia argillacea MUCL 33604]|uniref:Actin-like ATPase domain-containing protein n=1 Tax=Jaapia argillacea MUCL 33604 TaxID=933084 RepID=A0A067PZY8_9AGAM|nr:hypothetical protein JAAARDRAFT_36678 [Jaapia argillacea MUCL 33604]